MENKPVLDSAAQTMLRKWFKKIKLEAKDDSNKSLAELFHGDVTFVSEGKHSIKFGDYDSKMYENLQDKLSLVHSKSRKYGRQYAKDILTEAMWEVLDSNKSPNAAAIEAVEGIVRKLQVPIRTWQVYYPLTGFDIRKRTEWNFGAIRVVKATNKKFQHDVVKPLNQSSVKTNLTGIHFYAQVSVEAIDSDSALAKAKPILDLHIDTLNSMAIISGSTKHESVFSSYMAIGETVHFFVLIGADNMFGWKRCMSLSLAGFNPHLLRSSQFIKLFGRNTISRELRAYSNDFFIKRIFPALKWSGRAAFQRKDEEIFLYYFLALESIYFESQYSGELMKELKSRIYTLLFTNRGWLGSSIEPYNKFGHLYKLRSDIVHRGGVEVSERDIELIKDLVVGSLFKIMRYGFFRQMKTSEQFESWFNSQKVPS